MIASHPARLAAALAAAAFLIAASPPEPDGLWTGAMVSDTPASLKGAKVVDVAAVERLVAEKALLVDSGPADRKPEGFPADAIWKPTHRSVPGAHWFPGAGKGDLGPAKATALVERIGELAGGDKSKPIVTYCQPRCWGSWNVGKRLVEAGYTNVHWFPGGINAWQERNETRGVEPEAGWAPVAPPAP